MVQTKFGVSAVAARQMEAYTTAVLEATLDPPAPAKHPEWRVLMEQLAQLSCEAYREVSIALACVLVQVSFSSMKHVRTLQQS